MGDGLQYERDPALEAEIRAGIAKHNRERNARDVSLADELADLQARMAAVEAELRGRGAE